MTPNGSSQKSVHKNVICGKCEACVLVCQRFSYLDLNVQSDIKVQQVSE